MENSAFQQLNSALGKVYCGYMQTCRASNKEIKKTPWNADPVSREIGSCDAYHQPCVIFDFVNRIIEHLCGRSVTVLLEAMDEV